MTNYTKFAVKGVAVVLVVSLLAAFLGYIARLILARNLGVEEFGLFYAVFAFLGSIGLFKSLGFDRALIKFIPEFQHEGNHDKIKTAIVYVSLIQLVTNFIVIVVIYFLAKHLSVKFFHSPKAAGILIWLAVAFFIDSFVLTLKFAFQGFKNMAYFSGIDFIRMLLVVIISFIGFKLNLGITSPVVAYITSAAVLFIVFSCILVKKVFPDFLSSKIIFNMALFKKISKYSIFVMETNVASMLLYYTDVLVLTYMSTLRNVGLYNVALPTSKVLMYLPRAIGGVLTPLTSELWVKKEEKLLKDGINILYKYSLIIMVPLVFALFSFADMIISVLYGADYLPAQNAMRILSIGMIFAVLYGININVFAGIGRPEITSKIIYTAALFNLITNIILIPILGIEGAALTTTVSYLIMMVMGLYYMKKFIPMSFPIALWLKTLATGITFIASVYFLKKIIILNVWLEGFIVLSISGLIYAALLFLLKIININEIKGMYNRIFSKSS